MKKMLTLAVITVLTTAMAIAQTQQIPDFKNSPMLVNKDGSLTKLEKQNSEIKTKAAMYSSMTRFISITGGKSPVRVHPDASFIVKTDADTDPETLFYVQKSKGDKKNREIDMEKTSMWAAYGAKGKSVKKDQVQLTFEKIQEGVYKIHAEGLVKGEEYAFVSATQGSSGGQSTVFLFGVDQ